MKKLLLLLVAVALFATSCATANNLQGDIANDIKDNMDETTAQPDVESQDAMDDNDDKDDMDDNKDNDDEDDNMEPNFLDVVMTDIDGKEWNLSKLGNKAVVKVWASWCSICVSGLGELNTFATEYEDGVVLTVVSPDMLGEKSKEDFTEWFNSLEGYENTVVIFDDEGVLIKGLGVRAFPTYVFINSDGIVQGGAIGHQANADLVSRLAEIE